MESGPVKIEVEGVERFKKENCDLIIVDTSGRHKQVVALFEEMRQVFEAAKPDVLTFVMDGSIGQVAFDQAQVFKQSVVGAFMITKMDGNAREVELSVRKCLKFFLPYKPINESYHLLAAYLVSIVK